MESTGIVAIASVSANCLPGAIRVEGEHRFKQFAAVYYPGIDHMHAMIGSAFINRIGPGKQLGDTLALATIPVLSKLDGANQ